MGSPLEHVKAGIFMVEWERCLLPMLSSYTTRWKHYVDDTIAYVNPTWLEWA